MISRQLLTPQSENQHESRWFEWRRERLPPASLSTTTSHERIADLRVLRKPVSAHMEAEAGASERLSMGFEQTRLGWLALARLTLHWLGSARREASALLGKAALESTVRRSERFNTRWPDDVRSAHLWLLASRECVLAASQRPVHSATRRGGAAASADCWQLLRRVAEHHKPPPPPPPALCRLAARSRRRAETRQSRSARLDSTRATRRRLPRRLRAL